MGEWGSASQREQCLLIVLQKMKGLTSSPQTGLFAYREALSSFGPTPRTELVISFFFQVTSIGFADGDAGDQKRVMTPAQAKEIGSDYNVVGRPITQAPDPVAAYRRCVSEFVG